MSLQNLTLPAFLIMATASTSVLARADYATNAARFPTPATTWRSDNAKITGVEIPARLPVAGVKLNIADGKAGDAARARVTQKIEAQGDSLRWNVTLTNPTNQEIWVEVGLQSDLVSTANLRFWDGYHTRVAGAEVLQRTSMSATFPASALLWQSGASENGLVVGLYPDAEVSSLVSRLDPNSKTAFYGTKLAIPAGASQTLPFVLFTLAGKGGGLDAIQGYYDRFPAFFRRNPGVDPRIGGFEGVAAGYFGRNNISGRAEPNLDDVAALAAAHSALDWGYHTAKWTGDWVTSKENFDLPVTRGDRVIMEEKTESKGINLFDYDTFWREHRALYAENDRRNLALCFYVLNSIEEELINKWDATRDGLTNPKAKSWKDYTYDFASVSGEPRKPRIKGWGPGYGTTWHTFLWGTPLENIYKRDLPIVLKQSDVPGFAVDLFSDASPYYGLLDRQLPGRSYDENGSFVLTNLATKRLAELMHSLRTRDGFVAGVHGNSAMFENAKAEWSEPGNFVSSLFADTYMWESDTSYIVNYADFGVLLPSRYMMGQKQIQGNNTSYKDEIGQNIPWQTMSPNAIRAALWRYTRLRDMAYFQGGISPDYSMQRSFETTVRLMPQLLDVQRRGWMATSGASGNEALQRRRYGGELGAAIAVSNPTDATVKTSESFDGRTLGGTGFVAANWDGAPLRWNVNAEKTAYDLSVPDVGTRVVTFPIQISGAPRLSGVTSGQKGADKEVWRVQFQLPAAANLSFRAAPNAYFALGTMTFDGKPVGDKAVKVAGGTHLFEATFNSTVFGASEAQLRAFDWKNAVAVMPVKPDIKEQSARTMLSDYVRWYQKAELPAVAAPVAGKSNVLIRTDAKGKSGVFFEGANLVVAGRTLPETQRNGVHLARLMFSDAPFVQNQYFTNASTTAMLKKIGMLVGSSDNISKIWNAETLAPVPGEDQGQSGTLASFRAIEPLSRAGWKMTASSTFDNQGDADPKFAADDAKEGKFMADNRVSAWTSGRDQQPGEFFQIDLGAQTRFNHLKLDAGYPGDLFPVAYQVEVSDDGQTFLEVAQGEGGAQPEPGITDIYLDKIADARYVKISLTQEGARWWRIASANLYLREVAPQAEVASVVKPLAELPRVDVPTFKETVKLDGTLTDAVWAKAATLGPLEVTGGRAATQKTTAKIWSDGEALYFGVECLEENMDKLWDDATERDSDQIYEGDDVEIYLAPTLNEGAALFGYDQFAITPSAVVADLRRVGAEGRLSAAWDAQWQAKTSRQGDRWFVEARIPLAILQGGADVKEWRFNLARLEKPNGEDQTWAPLNGLAEMSNWGVLRIR